MHRTRKRNFEDEVPFAGFNPELALSSIKRLKEVVAKEKPIVSLVMI